MNHLFEQVLFLGDTHGVDGLGERLYYNQHIPSNSLIIHVGDVGLGFCHPNKEGQDLKELDAALESVGSHMWAIRGNHDNPAYWGPQRAAELNKEYPNIELIPDYTARKVNGKSFLFVGGAVSIDRGCRTLNQDWWEGEEVQVNHPRLNKCDVLVCHTAPDCVGPQVHSPFVNSFFPQDPTLEAELIAERKFIGKLVNKVEPSIFVCGHFHEASQFIDYDRNIRYRIVDINELVKLDSLLGFY
jgi:predicted phosphodiesterase